MITYDCLCLPDLSDTILVCFLALLDGILIFTFDWYCCCFCIVFHVVCVCCVCVCSVGEWVMADSDASVDTDESVRHKRTHYLPLLPSSGSGRRLVGDDLQVVVVARV